MKTPIRTHIYLLLSNLIYGASFTIVKEVIPGYIKPYGMILIRLTVTGVLFFIIQWFVVKEKIARRDVPLLIICALFGLSVNQLLFFKGLSMTTPISAALISTSTPILVFVFAALFHAERMGWKKIAGICVGAAGALLIITAGKEIKLTGGTFLGDLLILANSASYAIYLVIVKPLMGEFTSINWQAITPAIWWAIVFIIIFTTFFCYLLNALALKTTTPGIVGVYIYAQPIFATIIAVLFGKDQLNWQNILASILIFIGVYLVSFTKQVTLLQTHKV